MLAPGDSLSNYLSKDEMDFINEQALDIRHTAGINN